MSLEQENTEKRKNAPLSNTEAAWFFFFPNGLAKWNRWQNSDHNESEMERFKEYGFDRKIKQANEMRIFGFLFYFALVLVFACFSIYYFD